MSKSIDGLTYGDKDAHTAEEVKQGNPGRPQSDYENPPDGPSDEPPGGADRVDPKPSPHAG